MEYAEQPRPEGLPQAFLIGAEFLESSSAALILGENVFYGHDLPETIRRASQRTEGTTVFAYRVATGRSRRPKPSTRFPDTMRSTMPFDFLDT